MDGWKREGAILGIAAMAALAALGWGLPARAVQWRRVGGIGAGAVTALAADATGRRLAASAGETIFLSEDGGARWGAVERTEEPAADLIFLRRGPLAGSLCAATRSGARVSRDGHGWQALDLAGEGTRGGVRALAEDPRGAGAIALGMEAGLLVMAPDGARWQPATAALAGRSVDRLAWDAAGTLHAASGDGLYRIEATGGAARRDVGRPTAWVAASGTATLAVTDRGYVISPGEGAFRDLPGTREIAYLPARFAAEPGASGGFLGAAPRRFFRVRPETGIEGLGDGPPGEEILALLALPDGRVLAGTDRGLYETAIARVARAGEHPQEPSPVALSGGSGRFWRGEPGIEDVRSAVLRANHLGPGRITRNFHGARWRGLLPNLSLSARRQRASGFDRDADETFTSNSVRRLFDQSSVSDRETDLLAAAEWDLGSLLFNPDELDVSEESRRLVTLRDDVLDEVNQIYFERRRAILALARMGGPDSDATEEAIELRIRIDELTAKLDAWTDGYFSREVARPLSAR